MPNRIKTVGFGGRGRRGWGKRSVLKMRGKKMSEILNSDDPVDGLRRPLKHLVIGYRV